MAEGGEDTHGCEFNLPAITPYPTAARLCFQKEKGGLDCEPAFFTGMSSLPARHREWQVG